MPSSALTNTIFIAERALAVVPGFLAEAKVFWIENLSPSPLTFSKFVLPVLKATINSLGACSLAKGSSGMISPDSAFCSSNLVAAEF